MKRWLPALIALLVLLTLSAQAETVQGDVLHYQNNTLKSNQTLATGYIHDQLYHVVRRGDTAGSRLSGTPRKFYDVLKGKIAKVASGQLASTEFNLEASDFYGERVFPTVDKANEQFASDCFAALDALLYDCPYELYWYDKTNGMTICADMYLSGAKALMATLNIKMYVAYAYQNGTFSVNTAKAASIQTAVQTAEDIVALHSGENDRTKLKSYKDAICDRVSYNHAAADNAATPYGDPWQLIYVFDDDPNTTVVCEGYAKAFQYLCDLTTFSSKQIKAISVTGSMDGGAHMWNVVTLSDGLRYLVDVTNCDTDTVGYPDKLFLAGYTRGSFAEGYTYTANGYDVLYSYDTEHPNLASVLGEENLLMTNTEGTQLETDPPATAIPTAMPVVTPTPVPTTAPWETDTPVILPTDTPTDPVAPTEAPVAEDLTPTVGALKYKLSGSTATVTGPKSKNATKLTIPATIQANGKTYNVTAIKASAFKGMKKLTTVTIGKNVKTIGKNAFASCVKLKKVTGGAALTTIGEAAFKGDKVLAAITIPAKVKSIGKNAFNGCAKLKTITIKTTKLTTKNVGANAFKGIYKKATFKVPKAKKSAYTTLVTKKGAPKTVKVK